MKAQHGSTLKPDTHDIGIRRIFLANLFELIATMCECSGDFFADRFRNDVWPVMARHLEDLLNQLQRQRDAHSVSLAGMAQRKMSTTSLVADEQHLPLSTTEEAVASSSLINEDSSLSVSVKTRRSFKMSDTERQLIVSILTCLNRIFQQEEFGKAVEKLLGSVGFTLLPLLDIEDHLKIQELTMECLRSIIRIDCDILRRPLMELSVTRMPPCPLEFIKNIGYCGDETVVSLAVTSNSSVSAHAGSKTIITRCNELLTFVDSLSEQAIS